ncbi:MAG: protein phosphatase 2C domain-containing protein [Sporocytophaga sp.]|uniref:PP2C family protein-serine/threonine phosphatase n=1 Tax=Sporocytophaga sp. TaxID=2231183 RepID=UPI001B16EA0D|nr:protein phosphatase 2C domain-containing protein [Sporocytophaga sp.]MBO9700771.1 protein phosphatase 2C domain-containing protein [Sporocytophaga sp.]
MSALFDILGYSIPNLGKEKNGDSYIFEYLEEEQILVAIVADGVSKQPCDWFASETTCKKLLENFKKLEGNQDINQRLLSSISETNKFVINIEGNCKRMASTLSVIAWQAFTNKLYFSNIGDSRIYSLKDEKLEQLTKDDSIITKEKVLMHGGLRVIDKSTLTKVIGQDNITISIAEKLLEVGEIIILATDGFYDARKAVFNKIMIDLSKSENFKDGFITVINKLEMLRGDDLTAIVMKRN